MDIVIVGGGFGGVYAAKKLLKFFGRSAHITLLDQKNYFLFIPMLHEVATGGLCGHNISEPFRDILHGKNFTFLKDTALSIDLKERKIKTTTGTLEYDYVVMATGSTTDVGDVPGAQEYTLKLKNLSDALHIKNQIIESMERASRTRNEKEREKYCTAAIIGAGATGIELGLEIKEFMDQITQNSTTCAPRVILIQRDKHILHQFPELRSKAKAAIDNHDIKVLMDSYVQKIEKEKVTIENGPVIAASTIIWVAGIKPTPLKISPDIRDATGHIIVNEFLQSVYPNLFVIGDCASNIPLGKDKPLPALAQVASEQGKHVAKNIYLHSSNKSMEPFTYAPRGILLSLGRRKGIALIKGILFDGFFAWWLMRTIYLFKIIGTKNKLKTAYDWTLNLFSKRDTCQH